MYKEAAWYHIIRKKVFSASGRRMPFFFLRAELVAERRNDRKRRKHCYILRSLYVCSISN